MIKNNESKETSGEIESPATGINCSENPQCKVISNIGPEILFVDAGKMIICRYCLPFAQGFICTSAKRKELYHNLHV